LSENHFLNRLVIMCRNSQKGLSLVVIVVLVTLSALAAVYFYQTKVSEKQESPVLTENWEIYTNTRYGFTFKYPKMHTECCRVTGPAAKNTDEVITFATEDSPMWEGFGIFVIPNENNLPFEEFISRERAGLDEIYSGGIWGGADREKADQIEVITVDNQTGIRFGGYPSQLAIERIYIPFPDQKNILAISKNLFGKKDFDNTFDQIMTTFKFVSTPNEPKGWINYIDTTGSYGVDVPNNWFITPNSVPEGTSTFKSYDSEKLTTHPEDTSVFADQVKIEISYSGTLEEGQSLQDYLIKKRLEFIKTTATKPENNPYLDVRPIMLNDNIEGYGRSVVGVYVTNGKIVYLVQTAAKNHETGAHPLSAVIEMVHSSFKFIEAN
jgi:hypothetical protein